MAKVDGKLGGAVTPGLQLPFHLQIGPAQDLGRFQDVYQPSASQTKAGPEVQSGALVTSLDAALSSIRAFIAEQAKGAWTVLSGTIRWLENGVVKSATWVATRVKAAGAFVAAKVRQAWDAIKGWALKALEFLRAMAGMMLLDNNSKANAKEQAKRAEQRKADDRQAAAAHTARHALQRQAQGRQRVARLDARAESAAAQVERVALAASDGTVQHVAMPPVPGADRFQIIDDFDVRQAQERHRWQASLTA